jgi:hypothetical protein
MTRARGKVVRFGAESSCRFSILSMLQFDGTVKVAHPKWNADGGCKHSTKWDSLWAEALVFLSPYSASTAISASYHVLALLTPPHCEVGAGWHKAWRGSRRQTKEP